MARIYRTYTVHLFDAHGEEAFLAAGVKTLAIAQRMAADDLVREPSVAYASIEIQRFNGTFYVFERSEIVSRP